MAVTFDELEAKISNLLVKVEVSQKFAEKALDMAMDALIKVQSMKHAPQQNSYVDPFGENESSINQPASEEPTYEPTSKKGLPKISPFTAFSSARGKMQTVKEMNEELEKGLTDEQAMKAALWDDAMGDEEQ